MESRFQRPDEKCRPSRNFIRNQKATPSPNTYSATPARVVALAVRAARGCFALLLAGGIHEGVVFSNRDHRTLLDKLVSLLLDLRVSTPGILIADAYYASAKIIRPLIPAGWHLIAAVRSNAVAYRPANPPASPRGEATRLWEKIALRSCFEETKAFTGRSAPLRRNRCHARYRVLDLLWRPVGICVRFVLVAHPTRGRKYCFAPISHSIRLPLSAPMESASRLKSHSSRRFIRLARTPIVSGWST